MLFGKNNFKIGIIGVGMVGGTLNEYFKKQGENPLLYDSPKNIGSLEKINEADLIFICVPTPFDKEKGFDLSCVEDACRKIKGEKIVVIKSTVLPGSTDKLQDKYPHHKFLFNPEFLSESTALEDMKYPERQIIGYTKQSFDITKKVLDVLPNAPFKKIIPAKEAELVKYFSNTFYATKVIFANQIYQLCQKLDIDYEIIRECASADKRIGPGHLDVYHKGYRGYGGKCLPKDIKSLIQFAKEKGTKLELLETVDDLNEDLRKRQGLF